MYQYQVSFGEAIKRAFRNYCCFTGRASRSEYWWFALFTAIVSFVLNMGSTILMFSSGIQGNDLNELNELNNLNVFSVLLYLWCIAIMLPSWGLLFRRLHDTGRSGWNCLWSFLPCIGGIILIVFCCQDSQPEENIYGPVPNLTEM